MKIMENIVLATSNHWRDWIIISFVAMLAFLYGVVHQVKFSVSLSLLLLFGFVVSVGIFSFGVKRFISIHNLLLKQNFLQQTLSRQPGNGSKADG